MDRLLILINPNVPAGPSVEFGCYLARLTNASVTGVFLSELFSTFSDTPEYVPLTPPGVPVIPPLQRKAVDMASSIKLFKEKCQQTGVVCEVSQESLLTELLEKSAFYDLLVIDPKTTFYGDQEESPTEVIKDVLHRASCPVMVAPEAFTGVGEVVFCFDGSDSAAEAIRQFTYLFPPLKSRPVRLLEINPKDSFEYKGRHKELSTWLQSHYEVISFVCLEGNVRDELFAYLFKQKNKVVVLGAYGRSLISEAFRHSVANPVIRAADVPVFIYHK